MLTIKREHISTFAQIEVLVQLDEEGALSIWLSRNAHEKPEYSLKVVSHRFEEFDHKYKSTSPCKYSPTGYCYWDEHHYEHGMAYAIKWMGWGDVLCNIIADEIGYFVSHEERVELFNAANWLRDVEL